MTPFFLIEMIPERRSTGTLLASWFVYKVTRPTNAV